MIQDVLVCNKAMKQGKSLPLSRTCRLQRQPLWKDLQIQDHTWSKLKKETKTAWIQEDNDNKEMVIVQFVLEFKSSVQVTKNQHLHTVHMPDFFNRDGYDSDFTANTQNSIGTFQFNANSSLFDTTVDNNSNGEMILEGSDLNVNAAAARKGKPSSILRKKHFKSSEMPSGAITKMIANKQI